jgi:two-component system phosphate regulon sensor histidine kinase PhoR
MKSLRRILIFRYTLIVAATLVAVSLLMIIPIRSFTISREQNNLKEQAQLLARDFRQLFTGDMTAEELDAYIEALAGDLPVRLTLIDTEGKVLGDSNFPADEMENHAGRPEVASALEGRVETSRRESRTLDKDFIYAAAPVVVDGEIVGVARVALEEQDVTPVIFKVWWIFLAAFGFLLLVIVIISLWTERTVTAELDDMREAAAGLAAGDLDRRVAEPDILDFSELARDFNAMAERVRTQVEEAAGEQGKLEAVLNNISAGVMVTDAEGRIMLLNPAAEDILGIEGEKASGRRSIEVFSSREMDVIVSRAASGESVDEEIELLYPQNISLHLKSNPVISAEGRIVATVSAIEDITTLKRVNQIRQDFVANVSHELRTPVATVRALTDSLLDGALRDSDKAERFLSDLNHEATRLSQLIEDLLTLSRLEAEEIVLKAEEVPLQELFNECMDSKRKLAGEYGVALAIKPGEENATLSGDHRLLRTALNNLIDNAVKYNRSGGSVTAGWYIGVDEKNVIIEVADTGMGIPRDELPRVFERFYRVDKARSRETGGTGLGLSIVKHIADLHGGTVTVTSEENEGSVFSITIPMREAV